MGGRSSSISLRMSVAGGHAEKPASPVLADAAQIQRLHACAGEVAAVTTDAAVRTSERRSAIRAAERIEIPRVRHRRKSRGTVLRADFIIVGLPDGESPVGGQAVTRFSVPGQSGIANKPRRTQIRHDRCKMNIDPCGMPVPSRCVPHRATERADDCTAAARALVRGQAPPARVRGWRAAQLRTARAGRRRHLAKTGATHATGRRPRSSTCGPESAHRRESESITAAWPAPERHR